MEEADSLRLLSVSNLPPRYSNAIAEIIAAGIVQFSDENLEESEFLSSLRSAAPELGLHATAAIPFPFTHMACVDFLSYIHQNPKNQTITFRK